MKYLLVMLTHGDAEPLGATAGSLLQYVTPAPASVALFGDGARAQAAGREVARRYALPACPWLHGGFDVPEGFCAMTRAAWLYAAEGDHDYVLWLEHDFRFLRDVDLHDLAAVLDANARLAQMQLMRTPVNEAEVVAGGLFESRPGEYEPRDARRLVDPIGEGLVQVCEVPRWLEHRSYVTTNPSLMRRGFMAANSWPEYEPADQCEGKFGIDLVAAGYTFGVWGSGEPWVEHVGTRDGSGFGY